MHSPLHKKCAEEGTPDLGLAAISSTSGRDGSVLCRGRYRLPNWKRKKKNSFSKISKCLIACFSSSEHYTQHKSQGLWPSIFSVSGVPEIVSCSSSPSCRASCEVPPAAPSVLIFKALPGAEPTPGDTRGPSAPRSPMFPHPLMPSPC